MPNPSPETRGPMQMPPEPEAIARRALVARAGTLLAVASVPAVAGGLVVGAPAAAQTADDALLATATGLEQTLIALYGSALSSGRLDTSQTQLAETLREHARLHLKALERSLSGFARGAAGRGDSTIPGLGRVRSGEGYMQLALGFENQAYLAYLDAVGPLESADTRRLVASIAASSAQHLALLREQLGRQPVPDAFETGSDG